MKRVGNFINPDTGEEDWVEPESIPNIVLIPNRVVRVGENFETPIDFKMSYVESSETIELYAEYSIGTKLYRSICYSMPLEDVANEIALVVYANKQVDDSELIKKAKRFAMNNLTEKLFNDNIILSDFNMSGIGYVKVNNKKIMIFEEIEFKYVNKERHLTIKECIGSVSLSNLDSPQIVFNTNNHEIVCYLNKVTNSIEGKIKTYELLLDDIVVKSKLTPNASLESIIDEDERIKNRMKLLDSLLDEYDDFDDRFDDLF